MNSSEKIAAKLLHKILTSQSPIAVSASEFVLKVGLRGKKFDELAYSEWRGGLIDKGINPKIHAALFGVYSKVIPFKTGQDNSLVQPPVPDREWVLVVTHDQSRTGAPILALSLINELAKNFNVATIALGSGVLEENFAKSSNAYFRFYGPRQGSSRFSRFIKKTSKFAAYKFAIVNSMEASFSIMDISNMGIPCIALIHEYSSYGSRARGTSEGLQVAKAIVFSSSLTRDSMLDSTIEVENEKLFIIPQGRCAVPQGVDSIERSTSREEFEETVDSFFSEDALSVVGAGYVQFRKGLDLFVTLASLVKKIPGHEKAKFLWVGDGYSKKDINYGLFVEDQIKRLDLENSIKIIPSTQHFTYALQKAHALAMTSRLDPLPNVVIDAIFEGKHVVCFDKASGFPEIFRGMEVLASGVAGYLDIDDMAHRLGEIGGALGTAKLLQDSSAIVAFAHSNFSFTTYANRLIKLFD